MGRTGTTQQGDASVDLLWIPLGAGARAVRRSGRLVEALLARHQHRPPTPLFHSALVVRADGAGWAVEMLPSWQDHGPAEAVACSGPVGSAALGRSRWFRYDIRCWRGGLVPDAGLAVGPVVRVGTDPAAARRLLELARSFPTATWGRDEQDAGGIWSSNSLTAWLLVRSGHPTAGLRPPDRGTAPGWHAGLVVGGRSPVPSGSPAVP